MRSLTWRVGRCVPVGLVLVAVVLVLSCVDLKSLEPGTTDEPSSELPLDDSGRPVAWTEKTHGSDVAADYEVVFPTGKVNRLDITITPENWQAMQDDMVSKYGEPGTQGGGGALPEDGAAPDGGMGPGGGIAPPGDFPGLAEATEACEGLGEGDTCTLVLGSISTAGTCVEVAGQLACMPEGMPTGDADGSTDGLPEVPGGAGGGFGGLESTENPIYVPCQVEFEGEAWWYVGIRFKGQSSLMSTWSSGNGKLPLRFSFDEFEDTYPEIDNQRFYGFKMLSLASNWSDDSLLREKIAHDIFREAGVPAPRTAFYRVYIDHGEGATYFGLYTMTEIPDDPMLAAQFGDDSGNLYKPTSTFAAFQADDFDKETNEEEADYSDVQATIAALHADRSDAEAWRAGLEAVFNVDAFLHWLAVNTVIQNWDTYGNMAQNHFLYGDPSDNGRLVWIPWDNNMALSANGGMGGQGGGFGDFGRDEAEASADVVDPDVLDTDVVDTDVVDTGADRGGMGRAISLELDEVDDRWPLIRYLADDPVYWEVYVAYVRETVAGPFAVEATQARYQAAHDLIAPYVVGEEGEWTGYTFLSDDEAFYDALDELMTHVVERNDAVTAFLESLQ